MAKAPKTIQEQIALLKDRNMRFHEEADAPHFLGNISYYRLKGYWWEMQDDKVNHHFADGSLVSRKVAKPSFREVETFSLCTSIHALPHFLRALLYSVVHSPRLE